MTSRLRSLRWAAGAACALGVLLPAGPGYAAAAPAHCPGPALRGPALSGAALRGAALSRAALSSTPTAPRTPDAPDAPRGDELAGSVAGAGRARPGRAAEEAELNPQAVPAVRPAPEAKPEPPPPPPPPPRAEPSPAAPPVSALGGEQSSRVADLAAHMVPLGAGLALIGLGLAFLGMRLRR
ncbi:hypothetical protein ACWCQL_00635 [Streptomyces sp. NPDC002073]